MKESFIINNILPKEELTKIQKYAMNMWINYPNYDEAFGRHQWANTPELKELHEKLLDLAREYFEEEDILPSWCLMSIYEGKEAKLWKHRDDNACTYHINFSVFQKTPWELWVEGKPYLLEENDALFTYGNDLEHWREEFPDPDKNMVCNIFLFYCKPDHWYFTQGPDYLYTHIRADKNKGMM
jgi:hypothetical protein